MVKRPAAFRPLHSSIADALHGRLVDLNMPLLVLLQLLKEFVLLDLLLFAHAAEHLLNACTHAPALHQQTCTVCARARGKQVTGAEIVGIAVHMP